MESVWGKIETNAAQFRRKCLVYKGGKNETDKNGYGFWKLIPRNRQ